MIASGCLRKAAGSGLSPLMVVRSLRTATARPKVFEPDYLDMEAATPVVKPLINIQFKGHDFDVLESFQSFAHNLAENIGLDVSDSWATPCTSWKMYTYVEGGTKIKDSYLLHTYERNIQLTEAKSTYLPVLVDVLRRTLPEGVRMSIHEHKEEHYEARFIPDPFINGLKSELGEIQARRREEVEKRRAEKEAKGK